MLQISRPSKTINLCSTIMDIHAVQALQKITKDGDVIVNIPNQNYQTHLSQAARKDLFESIARSYELDVTFVEQNIDTLKLMQHGEDLCLYSSDVFNALKAGISEPINISCYEHSILYMLGWYYRAITNGNKKLEEKMKALLSTYLGDQKLAQIYIDNSYLFNESQDYFESLAAQPRRETVDNIIVKEINGEAHVLLGYRGHFPTGWAGTGGFVDKEDQENAEQAGIPSKEIYAALREGIEELNGTPKKGEAALPMTFGKAETQNGEIYYVTQGTVRLEIRKNELWENNLYEDNLSNMSNEGPSDPRMPVSTRYFRIRVANGDLKAGDDVADLKWVSVQDLLSGKIELVMPHHHTIYQRVLSGK